MHARLAQFLAIGMVLFSGALSPQSTLVTFVERGSNKLYIGANREYGYVLVLASWNRPALGPRLGGIEGVQEASRLPAKAELDIRGSSTSTWALGVGPGLPGQVNSGRFFTTAELEQGAGVCLLESSLLPRLSVDQPQDILGKEITARIGDRANPLRLRVVGTYTRAPTEGLSHGSLSTHPFLSVFRFLLGGGDGLIVPYQLLTRYAQEEVQSFFVNVEPPVGVSRVSNSIEAAFRSGDLQGWESTGPWTQPSQADVGHTSDSDQPGAGWFEQLPPGLTIVTFLVLVLGVGPYLVHLGFRWIMQMLTRRYGPTFPHDVMEVVTATLVVLWAIGAGVMGLALLFAHPQTIPREQTGLIPGLGTIPLGQMVAAFEQSPLARTHFILIRVLGALLVVASVAGLTYSVRHKAEGIIELVLFRLQRYAYAFFMIILTFFGGFLLIPALASTLSAVDHASHSSSASLTDNRLIEIYQPSYSEIQRRNPGLMGSAVPVANSLREQQTEFTIDELQEIKSLTSGIDYVYSTQALSTEWQGRSVSIVEATSDFFPTQEWQLLAGHMPKDSSEVLVDATTFGITEPEQARDWLGKTVSLTILGEGHGLRIVGVVSPEVGRYAPALLRPAPNGRTWTSAFAVASPDRDPVAVAAALQQAMDQRYGRYAWRVEALQSRTWRATGIHKRSQSAVRWLGVLSLLLVFGTAFGINRASRAKASSESTPDEPLPQGGGVPAFRRAAYHLTLGLLGGLLGAGVGKLVLARFPLPLLVPTTANAQAQPSAVLQVLIVAAAVGATTVIGSLVGGLMGCPSGNLVIFRHPQSTDDHSSHSGQRRQLSRLFTASFNTLLATLILSVGVGLLISFTSHEDMVRQAMREAESYGYLQLTPYASETGAAMSSELTESRPRASRPVGWAVVDLEYIRPYLPDRDTALALATSDEAYVYDQANNITYSALVIAGSAGLPAVRGWRLVTGRFPSEQEIADGAMVAVVSRDFGRLAWGVNNPNEYLKRSLLIRFTHGQENEYKELHVIGVMDWTNLALRWGGGVNTGFAPLPALFTPLGLSPQSLLPDGTVIGRSLEARSSQGDSRKLTSTLQQLASGFLRPTYGLVNIKDVRLASLASSLFDIYRQALWVQVRALVLMAMAGFLALGWTVGSALGLGFGFGLGSAVGLALDRVAVVSSGPDHEVPAVRGSGRQRRLLRRATLDFGIVLVFGYLLGILVASFLGPYLISPFLIDQIFLTTNADAVSALTGHGEFAGLVTVVIAAILLALCQAWQAAGSTSNCYQEETGYRPSMLVK